MPKSHARYSSEDQILKKIDALKAELDSLPEQIRQQKKACRAMYARMENGEGSPDEFGLFQEAVQRLIRLNRKMRHIPDLQLPKLGRKLAEFRTELLPGCGTDKSIPVK